MQFKARRDISIGSNTNHTNWLKCIRTRMTPNTDEEKGHRAASFAHLEFANPSQIQSLENPVSNQ